MNHPEYINVPWVAPPELAAPSPDMRRTTQTGDEPGNNEGRELLMEDGRRGQDLCHRPWEPAGDTHRPNG